MYQVECSINILLGFYKMSFRIHSVDQDQTAQTVGFTLSTNLCDIFLSKI